MNDTIQGDSKSWIQFHTLVFLELYFVLGKCKLDLITLTLKFTNVLCACIQLHRENIYSNWINFTPRWRMSCFPIYHDQIYYILSYFCLFRLNWPNRQMLATINATVCSSYSDVLQFIIRYDFFVPTFMHCF